MRTLTITGAAITATLALTLSACGGGDEPSAAEPTRGAIEVLGGAIEEESEIARQMRVQDLIAECMVEAGFEYTPIEYTMPTTDEDLPDWGTLTWAEEYGYGVTTNPSGVDAAQESADPNEEYVASMTDAEAAAYYTALYGDQTDGGDGTEEEEYDGEVEAMTARFADGGCNGSAYNEVNREYLGENGEWIALNDEIRRVFEEITAAPEALEKLGDWSDCMADAGYPGFAKLEDPQSHISERYDAILMDQSAYEALDENATDADFAAIEADKEARLSDLRTEEIATATADFTCREDSGYLDAYTEASIRLQQEFYDAHKAELEAYVEFMTQNAG